MLLSEEDTAYTDDDEDHRESSILDKPLPCKCPAAVSNASKRLGVTCQRVFEKAFATAEMPDYYGRGVFVAFLNMPAAEAAVPTIVQRYCDDAVAPAWRDLQAAKPFCMGCMIDPRTWAGLHFSYSLIMAAHLQEQKQKTLGVRIPGIPAWVPPVPNPNQAELERLWDSLELSDVLVEEDELSLEDLKHLEDFDT